MQARTAREFLIDIQLSMFKISGNSRRLIVCVIVFARLLKLFQSLGKGGFTATIFASFFIPYKII